jgi:hypothetical protein
MDAIEGMEGMGWMEARDRSVFLRRLSRGVGWYHGVAEMAVVGARLRLIGSFQVSIATAQPHYFQGPHAL